MRRRRDTATPNPDIIRCRFYELDITQTEFVVGRGFTLRTFQRALEGVAIAKISLRKIAEALSLPYEQVLVAKEASHPRAANTTIVGDRILTDVELIAAEDKAITHRDSRLIRLATNLRLEFQHATESRRPPLTAQDFTRVIRLINRIRRLDGNNGHAHYYAGEVKRWMGEREESHNDFFRYLDFYQEVFAPTQGEDAGLENCYRRGHGYCSERTAWIHHLLALDLWKLGRTKNDQGVLEHALKHAHAALDYFPAGFVQHTSTTRVRDALKSLLVKISRRSTKIGSPPRDGRT
jgi:hypothetical protein